MSKLETREKVYLFVYYIYLKSLSCSRSHIHVFARCRILSLSHEFSKRKSLQKIGFFFFLSLCLSSGSSSRIVPLFFSFSFFVRFLNFRALPTILRLRFYCFAIVFFSFFFRFEKGKPPRCVYVCMWYSLCAFLATFSIFFCIFVRLFVVYAAGNDYFDSLKGLTITIYS